MNFNIGLQAIFHLVGYLAADWGQWSCNNWWQYYKGIQQYWSGTWVIGIPSSYFSYVIIFYSFCSPCVFIIFTLLLLIHLWPLLSSSKWVATSYSGLNFQKLRCNPSLDRSHGYKNQHPFIDKTLRAETVGQALHGPKYKLHRICLGAMEYKVPTTMSKQIPKIFNKLLPQKVILEWSILW